MRLDDFVSEGRVHLQAADQQTLGEPGEKDRGHQLSQWTTCITQRTLLFEGCGPKTMSLLIWLLELNLKKMLQNANPFCSLWSLLHQPFEIGAKMSLFLRSWCSQQGGSLVASHYVSIFFVLRLLSIWSFEFLASLKLWELQNRSVQAEDSEDELWGDPSWEGTGIRAPCFGFGFQSCAVDLARVAPMINALSMDTERPSKP